MQLEPALVQRRAADDCTSIVSAVDGHPVAVGRDLRDGEPVGLAAVA